MWRDILISLGAAILASWALLVVALLLAKPDKNTLAQAARVLPDVLRLVTRLARDHTLTRTVRCAPWLLLAYLALPIDLIPDFIPALGYADDAILTVLVVRWVIRRAGPDTLARNWPGTADGYNAVARIVGLTRLGDSPGDEPD